MVIENDPSARIVLRSRGGLVHPGTCMVCGNGTCDDGYVDLGVYFDYEGTMYLCATCGKQVGELLGLFTPDEVQQIQTLADKLATENETLSQELSDARQHVSSVNYLLSSKFFAGGVPADAPSEKPQRQRKPSGKAAGTADSGEPAPTESVTLTGPPDPTGSKLRDITFD